MPGSSSWNDRIAVIKLGGSILINPKAYKRAAILVRNRDRAAPDERLVIVVSAQEGATNKLERAARKIVREPNAATLDLLWSTGEIRSAAILALELQALGVRAVALNIHQTGLKLSACASEGTLFSGAVQSAPEQIYGALAKYHVAIVPGFFATDPKDTIASLGRGGSDLTAVLLAKGLQACRCELIKDVPGYFSSDPHQNPSARPIPQLTFEQALEFADGGCDLVQRKAIEAAAECGLPLVIRSLVKTERLSRIVSADEGKILADGSPLAMQVV
jgi:aspartate kinase